MSKRTNLIPTVLVVLIMTPIVMEASASRAVGTVSQTGQVQITQEEASAFFQAKDWAKAASAYEVIVNRDPANAMAWFRLGISLHSQGKYAQAIVSYKHALDNDPGPQILVSAMFRLSRAYSMMKDRDTAFEWLNRALAAGLTEVETLRTEAEFESLRNDPRFKDVLAKAQANSRPCATRPEARQLDFWIGEWDVQTRQGQPAGTNKVELILGDCVLFENWTGAQGGSGKSFNFYDAQTGKWHQVWVDDRGGVLRLTGEYRDGAMRFAGETVARDGSKTLERLAFIKLSIDRVRQLWEQSKDGGKSWVIVFDGTYVRRKQSSNR